MDRSRRFAFNSICTAIMQITAMLCGFIVNRIILAAYSAETSGFVMSIIQYSSYFILAVAGVTGAASYALYAPLAHGDDKIANGILTKAKQVFNYIGFAVLALNLVIAFLYPIFIASEMTDWFIRLVIFVMSIYVFVEMVIVARFNTLLLADQRTHVLSLSSVLSYMLQMLVVYIFSKTTDSAVFICFSYLSAAAIRGFAVLWYARRYYPEINYKGTPETRWLKLQKYVLYLQIIYLLQTILPIFFTTIYTNLETVRSYATYNIVITGLQSILFVVVSNIPPAFGNIVALNETETLKSAYNKFELSFFVFLAFAGAGAIAAITDFIRLYTTGIENASFESTEVGLLFILNMVCFSLQIPQIGILQAKGMYKTAINSATVQIVLLCLLSLFLAPKFGMTGILIASVCGNVYRSTRLVFFIPGIIEGHKVSRSFIRQGIVVSAVLLSYFIYKITAPGSGGFFMLFLYTAAVIIFIGFFIIIIIFIVDRNEFLETVHELRRIFLKNRIR